MFGADEGALQDLSLDPGQVQDLPDPFGEFFRVHGFSFPKIGAR